MRMNLLHSDEAYLMAVLNQTMLRDCEVKLKKSGGMLDISITTFSTSHADLYKPSFHPPNQTITAQVNIWPPYRKRHRGQSYRRRQVRRRAAREENFGSLSTQNPINNKNISDAEEHSPTETNKSMQKDTPPTSTAINNGLGSSGDTPALHGNVECNMTP